MFRLPHGSLVIYKLYGLTIRLTQSNGIKGVTEARLVQIGHDNRVCSFILFYPDPQLFTVSQGHGGPVTTVTLCKSAAPCH